MKALFLTTLLLAAPVWATQERAQALYDLAVIPWEQGKKEGWEAMLNAAEAGHVEALCTIARAYQGTSLIVSEKADEYFKKAAERNGLCGMLALANIGSGPILSNNLGAVKTHTDWRQKVVELAKSQAEQGDIYAIKTYAFIQGATGSDNGYCQWMEKAAKLGDADAMKQLASAIEDGCGWYLIPGSRKKALHYWIKQAANHGNPKAMARLAIGALRQGEPERMVTLLKQAADMGDSNARELLAGYMAGRDMLTVPFPKEMQSKELAYEMIYPIIAQMSSASDTVRRSKDLMAALTEDLSPEQQENARTKAEEWMKDHQVRTYGLVFN